MTLDDLAPTTPIIVGVGFHQEKLDDPTACAEPYQLMVQAIRIAARDAGSEATVAASAEALVPSNAEALAASNADALLHSIESITVPQGMWEYHNPGALIRDALGCPSAKSILAGLGVLQLQLLTDLCDAIAAGERHVGVVVGGEAKYRRLRSTITGQPVSDTKPESAPPLDLHQTSTDMWCSDLESRRGLTSPVEFFAIIESALRHERGLTLDRHRDELAALYSRFSAIAAENPHAWRRDAVTPAAIRDASPRNAMLAFPYTKLHASQWNVNQAVAILVCSAARARALGLNQTRWIYPLGAAHSKHVVPLAQMRQLQSHRGAVLSSERALALAGVSMDDVTATELYSCFPAAIQSFARDLKVPTTIPWTVGGSMAFAGGPFNNASLEGAARMVQVLRTPPAHGGDAATRRIGLVSNLSGIFSKQACAVFSNVPNRTGYRFEDVTAQAAAEDPPVPLRDDYVGPAIVVGYTVVFQGEQPSHAIAICDLPDGARTVVRSSRAPLLTALMEREFCGTTIGVEADGDFHVVES